LQRFKNLKKAVIRSLKKEKTKAQKAKSAQKTNEKERKQGKPL
jgi:hypothetical protein